MVVVVVVCGIGAGGEPPAPPPRGTEERKVELGRRDGRNERGATVVVRRRMERNFSILEKSTMREELRTCWLLRFVV